VSLIRVLDFQPNRPDRYYRQLLGLLDSMGHVPFAWPAPNGYPDVDAYWMQNLLPRWNLVITMLNERQLGEANLTPLQEAVEAQPELDPVDVLAQIFFGRLSTADEKTIIYDFMNQFDDDSKATAGIALMLASPAFQYR